MPSPFPGMDPYLEDPAFWRDFHQSFITYCRDAINDALPDHYEARIEERGGVVGSSERAAFFYPDLDVARTFPLPTQVPGEPTALETEPVSVQLQVPEQIEEAYLRVWRREERTPVAVLELLSPSNKDSTDRADYLVKRQTLLTQPVHLVELDFLLGGVRLPMATPLPPGDYYVFVSRAEKRPHSDVYAWGLRQRLPRIRIPLLPPDAPVILDLQVVFNTAYDRGRYRRVLRYKAAPPGPLSEETARWLDEVLRPIRTPHPSAVPPSVPPQEPG